MSDITSNLSNPNHYTISGVAIDTSDATGQTAYVTVMGFGTPHVWMTTNAGASWTDFSGTGSGLVPDAPANTIVVDSASTVYVGTDVGVFSSPTSVANWTEVGPAASPGNSGYLPNVPVTKLRIFNSGAQKLLRASTYGRGVWEFGLIVGPDFQVASSNPTQTIFASQTATFNGTLTAFTGYNSPVTLSCATGITSPPGSCTFSPSSPVTPTSAGAPFSFTTSGAAGDYIFNVHGVGSDPSALTHDASVALHVIDFALTVPSPSSVSANRPMSSNATTFQVTASGSFNQAVTLSCPTGLPTGAACNFSPSSTVSPTAGNSVTVTLTISTTASTPTGSFSVTVSANTSGAPAPKTQPLALTVTALPDYLLAISTASPQSSLTANPPNVVTFDGMLSASNGYSSSVALTCTTGTTVPPSTCTFSPSANITPTAGGTPFTVSVASTTTGNYNFNIHGNGAGAFTPLQDVPLTFNSNPDFTLPATSGSQTVKAGTQRQYTLNFAPTGSDTAFLGVLNYTCSSGLPNLSSCTFTPAQIPGNSPASDGTVMLKISTTASRASLARRGLFYAFWISLPGLALLFGCVRTKKTPMRRTALHVAFGLALLGALLQSACGGAGVEAATLPRLGQRRELIRSRSMPLKPLGRQRFSIRRR